MRVVAVVGLLLALSTNPASGQDPAEEDALIQLTILGRHGDRASTSDEFITPTAGDVFFRGRGELATQGVANARKMGSAFRSRYITNTNCDGNPVWSGESLDGRYLPSEVYVQSSDVHRVLMTASSFTAAMFAEDLERIPAPVRMTPYESDDVLALPFDCLNGWEDLQAKYGIEDPNDMPNKLLSAMRTQEWMCEEPPSNQSDTILAEFANDRTRDFLTDKQKDCATGDAKRFMFDYVQMLGGSGESRNDVRIERSIGNLMRQILKDFDAIADCYKTQPSCNLSLHTRFNAYFGHDVHELLLLNVVSANVGARKFFGGKTPAFASTVAMELYLRNGSDAYVRMFVKDGVQEDYKEFLYCKELPPTYSRVDSFCTLASLRTAVGQIIGRVNATCDKPTTTSAPTTTTTTTTPASTTTACAGSWSDWSGWSPCLGFCNCGARTRSRTCNLGPNGCGCNGPPKEIDPTCSTGLPYTCGPPATATYCCAPFVKKCWPPSSSSCVCTTVNATAASDGDLGAVNSEV